MSGPLAPSSPAAPALSRIWALLLILLSTMVVTPLATADQQPSNDTENTVASILHILDYVGVDYPGVIQDGKIANPVEYKEQQEFADRLTSLVDQLPKSEQAATMQEVRTIQAAITQQKPGDEVTRLCNTLAQRLIVAFNVSIAPKTAPSLAEAKTLFQENCSMCHGAQGYGDGPNAASLSPVPANFHDHERQQHRSVYSLFNTISLGVAGTAMPAFTQLNSQQRWQLAFYVSNFYADDAERAKGEALWAKTKDHPAITNLKQLTQMTPAQMLQTGGEDSVAVLTYLRANPQVLQANTVAPIKVSRDKLAASVLAYSKGDKKQAYDLAVAAYLEGFELLETKLDQIAPDLRTQVEKAMFTYRDMIKQNAALTALQAQQVKINELLQATDSTLNETEVSSAVDFFSAFLILLREGIEAILILAAITAVLIKTGRRDSLRYIHYGWISALALGFVTWYVASNVITISGAHRELTEGLTALIAAAMLIYVGFWLHKQSYAMQWKDFVREKVSKSLTEGALTGLAFMAFLAVYREVFESVLFFQTLWLQTNVTGHSYIAGGAVSAFVVLILVAWLLFKFSVRLPLKLFFSVNTVFMYLLAIVFVGKGVAALQEAGKLPVSYVNFFKLDALGIYPNLQSLGMQLLMILIAVLLFVYTRVKVNRRLSLQARQS